MNIVDFSKSNYNLIDSEYRKDKQKVDSLSFKGAGNPLDAAGSIMNWIETGGFLVSFLIQDMLGMTAPRVGAAFLRDKDVTGEYNIQEGFEVLGREGLTGPCMMAIAPISFAIAARFGKSTGINSQYIKRFGDNLKSVLESPKFNRDLLKNKEQFKKFFYETNIQSILENTLGKEHVKPEMVDSIIEQLTKYENTFTDKSIKRSAAKKARKECFEKIVQGINDAKYSTGTDLELLNRVKVGNQSANNIKAFDTKDAFEALLKYTEDVASSKNFETIDATTADEILNKALAKRFMTNAGTMGATLGVLSVLPKIYARSSISPGAKTAMMQQNKANELSEAHVKEEKQEDSNVSFKGGKKTSWLAKLGEKLKKFWSDKCASELEYNGHNFTSTLMAGLSVLGLLAPRGMRAVNRAQVNEDGKKDLSELYEILIRDLTSCLSVVFAVPLLTRACISTYENKTGFVLIEKDRTRTGLKKFVDLINPYSSAQVMSNSQISALYNNIDSKDKMLNFCKYIDKNNGDLEKIISRSTEAKELFNEKTLDLASLKGKARADKNNAIISFIEKLGKGTDVDTMIAKAMKGTTSKPNRILSYARGLNSVPALITTFLISPYILGWFIPQLTYANTRRMHEKAAKEKVDQTKATN